MSVHGRGPHEALLANKVVPVVLFGGVLGVGEAVEGVEDVLEDLGVDVARPEEVEVLVVRDLGGDRLAGQLLEHGLDVDEGVAAAVDEDDGRLDVAGRVLCDFGVLAGRGHAHGLVDVIVVHLEALVADDLEPVDDALGAREGVQVRVRGELLAGGDVLGAPAKEEREAHVDEAAEQGRVEQRLPHGGGAEDGSPAEHEVEDLGRGLDEGVDNAVGQARGRHGGREGDEDVDLVVELGMDGQRRECLGGALGKANVREALLAGGLEDVLDAVGDIVEGEFVNGKVPELERRGRAVDRLFGVFVAAVVSKLMGSLTLAEAREEATDYIYSCTHPDVKPPFHKLKGQASLLVRQADPDLGVHQQAVMQIRNALLGALRAAVDFGALLALSPLQAVQAQQEPILCLDYVLFGFVSPESAQLDEIGGIAHRGGNR